MSIQSSELVWRKSAEVSDAGTNGGSMSSVVSVTTAKNNIFQDVSQAQRLAGGITHRKMFVLVNNSEASGDNAGLTLVAPRVFVETQTPGDDMINIFGATQTDIQSAITGSEQKYGMGLLNAPVSGGASVVVVNVEDWSVVPIFADGMTIRISDKTSISDTGNNEEYHVIDAGGVAVNVDQITLTLVGTLTNGYSAGAKVSSVYEPGDVECVVSAFSNTGSGTFTAAGITTDNTGTVQQAWRITFTSATAYTVQGLDGIGSVGAGNVGSDFLSATNPDTGGKYFTLRSADFGGTFTTNDTIDFTTSPAAIPVWYRRDVPAGASSLSGNSIIVAVDGESS